MRSESLTTPCFAVFQPQHLVVYPEDGRNIFFRRAITCQITMQYKVQFRCNLPLVDRNSSVGIATRYELDGPGIESRWGPRFSAPVQTGRGAHPASYTKVQGLSGIKVARAWR